MCSSDLESPYDFESSVSNVRLSPSADRVSVDLHWISKDGIRYSKVFTFFRNSYYVNVDFVVDNASTTDWNGYRYDQILRTQVVEPSNGLGFFGAMPTFKGAAIFTPEDKYQKIDFEDMFDANLAKSTSSGWVAMLQH